MESGAHEALLAALWADTAFLAGQGVMDYSLLVGVDRPGRVLVVGIIDFLRQVRSLQSARAPDSAFCVLKQPLWTLGPRRT